MKFHCDSCNARYSIPDDRVRGKVLKVRCKSCSAIITVREDAEPEVLESAATAPAPPDVDWYMSVEGEQTGPMKVAVAYAWLAKQAPGIKIYCWYNGFGDWKPVSDVAAFAGAFKRPSVSGVRLSPSQPMASPVRLAPAPTPAPTMVPSLRAPIAKPSPASTPTPTPAPTMVPSLRAPIAEPSPAPVVAPRSTGPALPARPAAPRRESTPADRVQSGARARPSTTGPTGPMAAPVKRRVPLIAPPSIPPMPLPGPAMPAGPGPLAGAASQSAANRTAAASGPLSPPAPRPNPNPIDPNLSQRPRAAASSPVDLFSQADAARHDDDLELDIEEPSRVISLDMLMAQRRNATDSAALGPALPGVVHNPAAGSPEARLLDMDGERAAFEPALGLDSPPPRRRSYMVMILSTVVVLALAAAGLAFVVLGGNKDKASSSAAGGQVSGDFENLGFQIDRPDRDPGASNSTGTRPAVDKGSGKIPRTRSDKRNGSSHRSDNGRSGSDDKRSKHSQAEPDAGTSTGSQGTDTGPLSPLSPDEVIRQSNRSQISFKRCYERAKKKDPFLEVRSLSISVKIDTAGQVTGVSLDKMDDSYLGECLKATVKRWKLSASTEGISTRISLEFER